MVFLWLLCSTNEKKEKGSLISNILSKHSSLHYHRKSMQDADILKMSVEPPQSQEDMTSAALCQRIEHNKHIIHQIVHAIRFLAKQGLPF